MEDSEKGLKLIVFKASLAAVWTDNMMSSDERRYLSHLVEALAEDEGEREVLRAIRLQEVTEDGVFAEIDGLDAAGKGYVFDVCLGILASDKRLGGQELRFLRRLRRRCGLGPWAARRKLLEVRRRTGAKAAPSRRLLVTVFLTPIVVACAGFVYFELSSSENGLEERTSGKAIEVSLFEPNGSGGAPRQGGEEVFEGVRGSIVLVKVLLDNDPVKYGSGSVIGTDDSGTAYVLTNRHVVEYDAASLLDAGRVHYEVEQPSGARFDATLDFYSRKYDLALLSVRGIGAYSAPIPLILKEHLRVGQRVYAVGTPLGLKYTFTSGVISALRDDSLQTDATVSYGSSGGPLVDEHGALCAVVTRSHTKKDFSFALYADMVLEVLEEREKSSGIEGGGAVVSGEGG